MAALRRFFNFNILKQIDVRKGLYTLPTFQNVGILVGHRYYRPSWGIFLRVMKERRKVAGPDRIRRRNEWLEWNYKSELYAFNRRLNENITEETLQQAFIHDSYLKKEEQKRKELDIPVQDFQQNLASNYSLISMGEEITRNYLMRYLSHCYDKLPKEGIVALLGYLMSEDVLSHVGHDLGTKELIFSAEYPPEKPTLAATFLAIIGSIAKDDSVPRSENFVLDFLCPQLIGKDVFDIWDLEDPLKVLNQILANHGHEECEPRLIFESGRNTIEAVYHVGLYSGKNFVGRGPGETVEFAVEMAAYDSLRKLFGLKENESPLYFGDRARALHFKERDLLDIENWTCEDLKNSSMLKLSHA